MNSTLLPISPAYQRRADRALLATTVAYLLINGAGLFETALIVPAWTAAPPASLALFHGPYGLDFKAFWITAHSLHELTFLLAIGLSWQLPARRRALLLVLAGHVAVRAWTLLYFAPAIIAFQQLPPSTAIDAALQHQAALWRNLNLERMGLFMLLSFVVVGLNGPVRAAAQRA